MKSKNFEIAKVVILNEQLGNPKDLELKVVENSLSDKDKEQIKQAVLSMPLSSVNYGYTPLKYAKELIQTLKEINAA